MRWRLKTQVLLAFSALLLGALSISLVLVERQVVSGVRSEVEGSLRTSSGLLAAIEAREGDAMQRLASLVANDPTLQEVIQKTDAATLSDSIQELEQSAGFEGTSVLALVDHNARPLYVQAAFAALNPPAVHTIHAIRQALELEESERYRHFMAWNGHLYLVAAGPTLQANYIRGAVLCGRPMDGKLAADYARLTGTDVLYNVDGTVTGSSSPALAALTAGAPMADLFERMVNRTRYLALAVPLQTGAGVTQDRLGSRVPGGTLSGASRIVVLSLDEKLGFLCPLLDSMRLVMGAAFIATLVLSMGWLSGVTRPLERLSAAMARVQEGDLTTSVQSTRRDEVGELVTAFNGMVAGLREKELLSPFVSRRTRATVKSLSAGAACNSGRVRATVFFCDIRSFTTLSEAHPPEIVIDLLNRYFGVMTEIIMEDPLADVDKFIGDAIMAVFHAPPSLTDATQQDRHTTWRAVRCAMRMMECLNGFNMRQLQEGQPTIRIGVGINTGLVVEGSVGAESRREHAVLGDVVNVASRVEAESKYGTHTCIILAEYAYDPIADLVDVAEMPSQSVRGRTSPVRMFEVVRLRHHTDEPPMQALGASGHNPSA